MTKLLQKALGNATVNAVVPNQLHTLNTKMTTFDALEKLTRQYKTLSAPLLDSNGKAVGILSVMNLVEYFISRLDGLMEDEGENDFFERQAQFAKLIRCPIGDILNKVHLDKFVSVENNSLLIDTVDHFVKGVHRAAVVDSKSRSLISILTQSALIRFAAQQPDYLGKYKNSLIKDFPDLGSGNVIGVHKDTKTYEAFKIMKEKGISGLPLLDDQKKLIGNISNSNFNEVKQGNIYSLLQLPVTQYMNRIRQQNSGNIGHPSVGLMETSQVGAAFVKLIGTRMHRIYVVDTDHRVTRVITLRDMIAFLNSLDA